MQMQSKVYLSSTSSLVNGVGANGALNSIKEQEENKKGVGTREKGLMVEAVPSSRKFKEMLGKSAGEILIRGV